MKRAPKTPAAKWVLGAMSGTSLDGIDAAMLRTDGQTIFDFGPTHYRPYSEEERAVIRAALGKWAGPDVQRAEEVLQTAHQQALQSFQGYDLIGFHGQTLAHAPRRQGTFQAGDGAALAEYFHTPVAWDFRSADVELGGEGAPLAPFFHFALAKFIEEKQPIAFLNLGGVGNITFVDPSKEAPDQEGALLAFDTGPANAPINDFMHTHYNEAFDMDGARAARGVVEHGALELFLADPYFARIPPKSLDRNDFAIMRDLVAELEPEHAVATLTAMCAASVAAGMEHCPKLPKTVYVCGGGRRNPVLLSMIQAGLDCPAIPVEEAGLDGDMLEAQAFAFLAARVQNGLTTSAPSTTGVRIPVGGGTLSVPNLSH